MKTAIRNGTVIAWNGQSHTVLENGVVVVDGNRISFVGGSYDEPVDNSIDAAGRLVIPGLVNAHLHVTDTLYTKGYLEDFKSRFERPQKEYTALL